MSDSDISLSLARKSSARQLWILVVVQIVGLCVPVLSFLVFGVLVPNSLGWRDGIVVFNVVGVGMSVGSAMGTCHILGYSKIMPTWIQTYGRGGYLFLFICVFLTFIHFLAPLVLLLLCFWYFGYCLIPQFLIARWLAKEPEDDTM